MEEKRESKRWPLGWWISYRPEKTPQNTRCVIEDISYGGARLRLPHGLRPGDAVKMMINIPGQASAVNCTGQVVWTRMFTLPGFTKSVCGVKFVAFEDKDKKHIFHYISELSSYEVVRS